MRVCLLTRWFDLRHAGIGRVSMEILKRLVKRGLSVHKISTNYTSLYSYLFYTFFEIPIRLPRKGIDVYHALTPVESIWLPKEKSVVTIHDLFPITNPERTGSALHGGGWRLFAGRNYFKFASKQAGRGRFLACNSEKTKQDVIEYLRVDEEKVKVIRLGIGEDLRPRSKKDSRFRLGYLGQLDRRKRVDLLIRTFRESDLDAELVIGGTGIDKGELRELAGSDGRIRFLSFVPDEELVDFYNSLDVFVFPTMIEGYGLPIVEAMACRKPVVVLSDAIIPQEVKSRCVIVEDLDGVFGSSNYLEGLLKYVDYEGNYEWAKEHSWSRCVDEYIKLYEEVASCLN